jgi:hypothetical protein
MNAIESALSLYYQDKGDWPSKPGDGRMVIDNSTNGHWGDMIADIKPYFQGALNNVPYTLNSSGIVMQGYSYMKGTTTQPVQIPMYNGLTGQYIACIVIYDGYYLEAIMPAPETKYTLNDGGVDPDSLDHIEGAFTINPLTPPASCPVSSYVF